VKGIVQLVQGPQYATGVGLVRYGAQKLAESRLRAEHGARIELPSKQQMQLPEQAMKRNGGFWTWFKAAF